MGVVVAGGEKPLRGIDLTRRTNMKICIAMIAAVSMAGCMADDAGTLGDGDELATNDEVVATGQSEDALIILPPAGNLSVVASVATSAERRWVWDMAITPPTGLVYSPGQSNFERFGVHFWTNGPVSSYAVSGRITVTNSSTTRTNTVAAVVAYAGEVAATLTCPSLPAALAPGASLTCGYRASLRTDASRTLVSVAIPVGRPPAFALNAINFAGTPVGDVDRVIEVTASGHGLVTAADANFDADTHTSYHRQIGPFSACGPFTSTGVASLRGVTGAGSTPSGTTISRPANATGTVACP
jgi:hypothetical protein